MAARAPNRQSAAAPKRPSGAIVAGRPAIAVTLPSERRFERIFVWRDARVLLLGPKVHPTEFLARLGGPFKKISRYNWPAELLNDRVLIVEATTAAWNDAHEFIEAAIDRGELYGIGRVAFRNQSGGPHAALLLSGFSATLADATDVGMLESAGTRAGVNVTAREVGGRDIIVRPAQKSSDPLVLIRFASQMVSDGLLKRGSVEFDWAVPIEAR